MPGNPDLSGISGVQGQTEESGATGQAGQTGVKGAPGIYEQRQGPIGYHEKRVYNWLLVSIVILHGSTNEIFDIQCSVREWFEWSW